MVLGDGTIDRVEIRVDNSFLLVSVGKSVGTRRREVSVLSSVVLSTRDTY
jgi:hypothetical protein